MTLQAQRAETVPVEPRLGEPVVRLPLRGVPTLPRTHVDRPRLRRALATARRCDLILVSAPAGAGKTELLAQWARHGAGGRSVGWITFERGDHRFWVPFMQALADAGVVIPHELQGWNGAGPDARVLAGLVDAVRRAPRPVAVVLDNWEPLSRQALTELDVLLRHCGGRLLLAVASRLDPRLPLSRYRLHDTVLELRATDLAWREDESEELLARLGVTADHALTRELTARVSGWAAGLVLLGRAARGGDHRPGATAHMLRHTGALDDYLVSEVLDTQPPRIREFMLESSVLETLCPDEVERWFGPAARMALQDLTHRNAFLEPVTGNTHCFRFQPFFREFLRAQRAHESTPETVRGGRGHEPNGGQDSSRVVARPASATGQPLLVEQLTPREMEVLWHLEELLTTEEMAATMFVSVNTVRTHVRSVLRKLGVDRRNAAVRRARDLGLIPPRIA